MASFTSDEIISEREFYEIARRLSAQPFHARKTARVAARRASRLELVETRWNGVETSNTAQRGDWIVTSLGRDGAPLRDAAGALNTYVVPAGKFSEKYRLLKDWDALDPALGRVYAPKGEAIAILLEDGFDILAPWGERQRADRGYLLLSDGSVYGNHAETFEATYEPV